MFEREYHTTDWLKTATIYEVNIRQYTNEGTFNAFAKELPRLNDMGVDVLWLMPIHPIGLKNRKGSLGSYYSVKDFKAVNPEFGTMQDFKFLVDQVHQLGMKLIIDWVANHAAWDNVWTKEKPDYFKRDESGNFLSPNDWSDVIQIDHTNTEQQEAMIDAMKFWVTDFNIDGFRADLAHLTPLPFWKKARTAIEPLKADLFWLAETEEISYHEVFDASYTWEWMHKVEEFKKGNTSLNDLIELLMKQSTEFPASALRMYFTSNHDENTWNGTEYEKYGDLAKALAVFSFTWNGIPMIYSGQELPNNKRLDFFEKDTIDWKENNELHDFYKVLIQLKKSNPAITAIDTAVSTQLINVNPSNTVLSYLRTKGKDEVLVLLNLKNEHAIVKLVNQPIAGIYREVFTKKEYQITEGAQLEMSEYDFFVLEKINS